MCVGKLNFGTGTKKIPGDSPLSWTDFRVVIAVGDRDYNLNDVVACTKRRLCLHIAVLRQAVRVFLSSFSTCVDKCDGVACKRRCRVRERQRVDKSPVEHTASVMKDTWTSNEKEDGGERRWQACRGGNLMRHTAAEQTGSDWHRSCSRVGCGRRDDREKALRKKARMANEIFSWLIIRRADHRGRFYGSASESAAGRPNPLRPATADDLLKQ